MRRDAYVENDSGGFSVIAASAVDAIIEDGRSDDAGFVAGHRAILLMLHGDDSMPVRVVVDEPLTPEEQAQWLTRVTGRLDLDASGALVMGGFDPDVLQWWKDDHGPGHDGRGVVSAAVPAGSWRVDVYGHVGSMNGRHVLREAAEPMGAAFRRSHPGRAFPPWLAQALDFSGDEDPGHEHLWADVPRSVASGELALDADAGACVGFLVHFTRTSSSDVVPEPPGDGWWDADAGARVPATFPVGLPTGARDPDVESFLDRALRRARPSVPPPAATAMTPIVETWDGEPLRRLEDGATVELAAGEAFLLHWMLCLGADAPPLFELLATDAPAWTPPEPTPEHAVVAKGSGAWALGPPPNAVGWFTWWSARGASAHLASLPDGATLDLAARRPAAAAADDDVDGADGEAAQVGRGLFSGSVHGGTRRIAEASPATSGARLGEAVAFVRRLVERLEIPVRDEAQAAALRVMAEMFAPEDDDLAWGADAVKPADEDLRTVLLLAGPVFRTRFAGAWPMDPIEDPLDDD